MFMTSTMAASPAAAQPSWRNRKAVGRAEASLRHDGGGAEDHHQPDEHEQQDDGEEPLVDADAHRH